MNQERLLKMAEMLRNLPAERREESMPINKFDLTHWQTNTFWCGTTACAVGHAMYHPWFIAQGLTRYQGKNDKKPSPRYKEHYGWPATSAFFEITRGEAGYLFSHDQYLDFKDPIKVAERIEKFVAERAPKEEPLRVPTFSLPVDGKAPAQ